MIIDQIPGLRDELAHAVDEVIGQFLDDDDHYEEDLRKARITVQIDIEHVPETGATMAVGLVTVKGCKRRSRGVELVVGEGQFLSAQVPLLGQG